MNINPRPISYDQKLEQMLAQAQRRGNETAARQLTDILRHKIPPYSGTTNKEHEAQISAAQADRERQTKRWQSQRDNRQAGQWLDLSSLRSAVRGIGRLLWAKADRLRVSERVYNIKAVAANSLKPHAKHLPALALGIALALAAMLVLALAGCGQGSGLGPKDIELNTTNLIAILVALGLIGLVTVALTRGK